MASCFVLVQADLSNSNTCARHLENLRSVFMNCRMCSHAWLLDVGETREVTMQLQ